MNKELIEERIDGLFLESKLEEIEKEFFEDLKKCFDGAEC